MIEGKVPNITIHNVYFFRVMDESENVLDWLFEDEDSDDYEMAVNTLKYTDEKTVRRVYALGRTMAHVFKAEGLKYWSSSGTTLGMIRHGGLIPWDDDLDICIFEQVTAN